MKNDTLERARSRSTAEARRAAIITAAIAEFARHGYAGGSTEAISRAVGVSQPYLFKLFGTKKALFLAAYDDVWDEIDAALEAAVAARPDAPLDALREAFAALCTQRDHMLLTLQAYAAAADDAIRTAIRARETAAFAETVALTSASPTEVRRFFADVYLLIIGTALDIPEYRG